MWRISDDDLAAPLGAIVDAGVDGRRTVYLLDSQVKEVRRIGVDGSELSPLGREGEGPGEMMHPALVAGLHGGGCVVVQHFHGPAVCLLEDGRSRTAPDLDLVRDLFGMTVFMGTARSDVRGRLLLVATTTERSYDPARPDAELGSAMSVFRITPGDARPDMLFTNSPALGDDRTVRYRGDIGFFPLRSWDVGATGRLIYADPDGGYRVLIGHPADGRVESLELAPAPGDEEAITRRARAERHSADTYPRIADVQWVTEEFFLIKPIAAAVGDKLWQTGVFELFDLNGVSFGRRATSFDYNPDQDLLFLRGSIMVVIRSGKSAYLASIGVKLDAATAQPDDEIVVEAYDVMPW